MKTIFVILITISFNLSFAQTNYTWVGGNSANFSAASSWNPIRTIGLTSDILIFDNGQEITANNVYQVTIGQLKVINNTTVTLTPTNGDPKCISIHGGANTDLVVEAGSTLKIMGNDPKLGIYLKAGATAEIFGTIILYGEQPHYLNALDNNSFRFKNGSTMIQNSPGYAFTNNASSSDVIFFENGAKMKIQHISANSPFGLALPNTKVNFEQNSILSIENNSPNILAFNGRKYGNIEIASNSNIVISENINSIVEINNITVNNGSQLRITNINQDNALITISGAIYNNGTFYLSENITLYFLSNLDSYLSGNGVYQVKNSQVTTSISQFVGLSNNTTPVTFTLSQNYPNPFNPATKIDYSLGSDAQVNIKVYDITGREVMLLKSGYQKSGTYNLIVDASQLSSGVYIYKMSAKTTDGKTFDKSMKMIVSK